MGKGSTKVEVPDPFEIAQADARYNRIDQYTPLSNLQYTGPERNVLTETLNPALQHTENQGLASDMMLNNMALSRQSDMKGGSLPSLTTGINPTAQQSFFGTPQNLQQGFDAPSGVPNVPDFIGDFQSQQPTTTASPFAPQGPNKFGTATPPQQPGPSSALPTPTGPNGTYEQNGPITPSGQGQPQIVGPAQAAKGGFEGPLKNAPGTGTTSPVQPPAGGGYGHAGGVPGTIGGFGGYQGGGSSPLGNGPSGQGGGKGGGQLAQMAAAAQQQVGGQAQQAGQKGGQQAQPQGGPMDQQLFGGSLGALVGSGRDFGLDPEGINRQRVESASFERNASLVDTRFRQAEEQLQQDMANRGIPRGSEAYDRELSRMRTDQGETYGRMAQDAVTAGGAEVRGQQQAIGQLFGMGDNISQRDIQAQLQNANISQSNRATQFNELASLLGLNQIASPGLQNFFAPGNVDVGGAFAINQQAQQNNANNAQAQKSGMMDAATGMIPSDRRVKRDIEYIGDHNGHKFYEFEYIWADEGDKSIGVMADEVPQELVGTHPLGFKMVDYSRIL